MSCKQRRAAVAKERRDYVDKLMYFNRLVAELKTKLLRRLQNGQFGFRTT